MVTEKSAIVIFSEVDNDFITSNESSKMNKLRKEGVVVPLTSIKNVKVESLTGAEAGESMADAAKSAGYVVDELSPSVDFFTMECSSEDELLAALDKLENFEAEQTLITLITPTMAVFSGLGVKADARLDKPIQAASIAPTIAWIADLPLPAQVTAAPAYSVLNGLNFKCNEIVEMKNLIDGLVKNIEQDK